MILWLVAWASSVWSQPAVEIPRAGTAITVDGKLDEPAWVAAPSFRLEEFPWWKNGARENTIVKLLWDDENLYVAHISQDAHITARHTERDGRIPEDDCFEFMILPDPAHPNRYFNLEWNVIGGLVDNFRPNGPHAPRAPKWDAGGVLAKGSYAGTLNQHADRDGWWLMEVAIPFHNFRAFAAATPPKPGSHWLGNFNRHGGEVNRQYAQWSAGDTPEPSFHTPHRFGKLIFSAKVSPF